MKKFIRLTWVPGMLLASAAAVVLSSGCASPAQHSFNQDYHDNLPVNPMYSIHDEDGNRFFITVRQGTPSDGAERVINVKEAATTVAKAECQRLGWDKWDLNYIQERNQGWMHVVIAKVTRE